MKITVKAELIKEYLRKVYLGNLVEQCVFTIEKNGTISTNVRNKTEEIFLSCYAEKILEGVESEALWGIGDMSMFCKLLSTFETGEDVTIQETQKVKLAIKRKKRGQFNYLLSEPEGIGEVDDEWDRNLALELLKRCDFGMNFKRQVASDFVTYMSIVNTSILKVKSDSGKVTLIGGGEEDHQFKLLLGSKKGTKGKFEEHYDGRLLLPIISVLDFENGDPQIYLGEDCPIAITQYDNKDIWFISKGVETTSNETDDEG